MRSKRSRVDTRAVIERVISLFRHDSRLMDGFNIFLPNGFHINEALTSLDARSTESCVTVTTPQGTVNHSRHVYPVYRALFMGSPSRHQSGHHESQSLERRRSLVDTARRVESRKGSHQSLKTFCGRLIQCTKNSDWAETLLSLRQEEARCVLNATQVASEPLLICPGRVLTS